VARKNAKQTRYDRMTQWQQRRVDRKFTRRKDGRDWAAKLFEKLKEGDLDGSDKTKVR